jgi:hypothetical protein
MVRACRRSLLLGRHRTGLMLRRHSRTLAQGSESRFAARPSARRDLHLVVIYDYPGGHRRAQKSERFGGFDFRGPTAHIVA